MNGLETNLFFFGWTCSCTREITLEKLGVRFVWMMEKSLVSNENIENQKPKKCSMKKEPLGNGGDVVWQGEASHRGAGVIRGKTL